MKTTLAALLLLYVTDVQGQILVYKMSMSRSSIGFGFTTKQSIPGHFVVDIASGAAIQVDVYTKEKTFSIRNKAFTVRTVHGSGEKSYSVLAAGGTGAGSDNWHYTLASTVKGVNVPLEVGLSDTKGVPRTLKYTDTYAANNGTASYLDEEMATLVLDLPATKKANSSGNTPADVIASIRSDLVERGFKSNHPPTL